MTVTHELFTVTTDHRRNRLALYGELDVAHTETLYATACEFGDRDLTIDLTGLEFIDAAGLGAVVRIRTGLRDNRRRLALTGATPRVSRAFSLGGLGGLLT
jgi:anti-anti-sigma factor